MKKIALSVDEETYRLARIAAAERNTTVSALVRDYLRSVARRDEGHPDLAQALFSALDRAQGLRAVDRMSREEAHGL